MMTGLSAPVQRFLALALLAIALVLGWQLVLSPLADLARDREADIALLTDQLEHLNALAARRPGLDRQAHSLQAQINADGFWTGSSTAAVIVAMQDKLRQAITAGDGRLKSTSEAGVTVVHGLRKVGLRLSVDGTIGTLQKVLEGVEAASPALFVDSIVTTTSGASPAADRPPVLSLELTVAGYMLAGQP